MVVMHLLLSLQIQLVGRCVVHLHLLLLGVVDLELHDNVLALVELMQLNQQQVQPMVVPLGYIRIRLVIRLLYGVGHVRVPMVVQMRLVQLAVVLL